MCYLVCLRSEVLSAEVGTYRIISINSFVFCRNEFTALYRLSLVAHCYDYLPTHIVDVCLDNAKTVMTGESDSLK